MDTKARPKVGEMKGGIRQRGDSWEFRLYVGYQPAQRCLNPDCPAFVAGEAGKTKQRSYREWIGAARLTDCPKCGGGLTDTHEARHVYQGGFAKRVEAANALTRKSAEYLDRGSLPETLPRLTLAEFLRDVYLPDMEERGDIKLTTKQGHRIHIEQHFIGPASEPFSIGMVELRKLTTRQITAHYRRLLAGYMVEGIIRNKYSRPLKDKNGHVKRGLVKRRGLALKSIRRVNQTLHSALELALTDDYPYLHRNPAHKATKKLGKDSGNADAVPRALPAWSESELLAFLAGQAETPLGPLWHTLAYTGMRRGEALGLQRGDIDLDGATITVRQTRVPVKSEGRSKSDRYIVSGPKSGKMRVIDLVPQTVEVLRGVLWSTVSPADLDRAASDARWVFCDAAGEPLGPNPVSYRFGKAVKASGLRAISLHGLRHTYATILLTHGVPVHIVSAALGHADSVITMKTYAHCLPRAQEVAVQVFATLGAEPVT